MLPRLYNPSLSTDAYDKNGLGFIKDCISCDVTESTSGEYYLEAVVKADDRLASEIDVDMIIKAKANDADPPQLFEINKVIVKSDGRIQLNAQHIKYLCFQNYITSSLTDVDDIGTPQGIINRILQRAGITNIFTFYSDITDQSYIDLRDASTKTLGEIFGGKENSITSVFGGFFHFNNFRIELLTARGQDTGKRIAFGHNLSSWEQTLMNDSSYSHFVGYTKINEKHDNQIFGYKIFNSSPITQGSNKVFPKVKLFNFSTEMSDYFGSRMYIDGELISPSRLEVKQKLDELTIKKYAEEYSSIINGDVNIKINYRPELDNLKNVGLYDTVTVVLGNGRTFKSKVSKVKYDSLNERYKLLEIGESKPVLSSFMKKTRR